MGSLLSLWGHSAGQHGQLCRESRRKRGVLRKFLAVLWIEVDKLTVKCFLGIYYGTGTTFDFLILHEVILFSCFLGKGLLLSHLMMIMQRHWNKDSLLEILELGGVGAGYEHRP